jgi:hypothetical protein
MLAAMIRLIAPPKPDYLVLVTAPRAVSAAPLTDPWCAVLDAARELAAVMINTEPGYRDRDRLVGYLAVDITHAWLRQKAGCPVT